MKLVASDHTASSVLSVVLGALNTLSNVLHELCVCPVFNTGEKTVKNCMLVRLRRRFFFF